MGNNMQQKSLARQEPEMLRFIVGALRPRSYREISCCFKNTWNSRTAVNQCCAYQAGVHAPPENQM